MQNYPNPFNPTTTIGFIVAGESAGDDVRLAMYDVLGQEVDVLVLGEKQAGTYTVTWDASRFPAGVYFCRLTVGRVCGTTKMLLVK